MTGNSSIIARLSLFRRDRVPHDDPARDRRPRYVFLHPACACRLRVASLLPGLCLHEAQGPGAGAGGHVRAAADGHRAAADLQRDVRGEPPHRCRRADGLPARSLRGAGAGRLDRRDAVDCRAGRPPRGGPGARHHLSAPHRSHRLQGGRARSRDARSPRASSSRSSTPTSCRRAEFLHKTIHHFVDPKVAVVQARWGHINADYSLLTKIQSILLDAHFVLEHGGRNRAGHFFNFNGTAGIWRREAIIDGGGWQHDTLTEDLDLSYRTQLRGWKFHFRARRRRAGGAAGRDERLQVAAASLGQGVHPDLPQAAAADSGVATSRSA